MLTAEHAMVREKLFESRRYLQEARDAIVNIIHIDVLTEHDVELLVSMHKNLIGMSTEILVDIDNLDEVRE